MPGGVRQYGACRGCGVPWDRWRRWGALGSVETRNWTSRWGARRRRRLVRFELGRCQHTERRVSALTIVEDLEVVEECGCQLQASRPDLSVEELDLHAAPE